MLRDENGGCPEYSSRRSNGSKDLLAVTHYPTGKNPNKEILLYTQQRQIGFFRGNEQKIVNGYISRQVPGLLKEKEFSLGNINKIFASQWLNDKQVAFGTKCNKLLVLDINTGRILHIPSLKSSAQSLPADGPCGIHSIALNPSGTLLATGAENTNDIAVYSLPTFDPVMLGECGHSDWIFDVSWVDDEFFVTGSRDSYLALWRMDTKDQSDKTSRLQSLQVPEYSIKKPETVKICDKALKVRALVYNDMRHELACISLNGYFYTWDVGSFSSRSCRKLYHPKENVCMALSKERSLYAIGSQSHVNLVDPRTPHTLAPVRSQYRGGGVRSLSFREDILTIGTGIGHILFYDIKAEKYMECECSHPFTLDVSRGWLMHDDNFQMFFMDHVQQSAIFTHQYDATGTRLFAAGGPLPAGLWGNYAGLWA